MPGERGEEFVRYLPIPYIERHVPRAKDFRGKIGEAITDGEGRAQMQASAYSVFAAEGPSGQRSPYVLFVGEEEGFKTSEVAIHVCPTTAATGRVLERGKAVVGASVKIVVSASWLKSRVPTVDDHPGSRERYLKARAEVFSGSTDASGEFLVSGCPAVTCDVSITDASGRGRWSGTTDWSAPLIIDLDPVRMQTLVGVVRDTAGKPVVGADVVLREQDHSEISVAETSETGEFSTIPREIPQVPRSTEAARVVVRQEGYAEVALQIPLSEEEEVNLGDIVVFREASITMDPQIRKPNGTLVDPCLLVFHLERKSEEGRGYQRIRWEWTQNIKYQGYLEDGTPMQAPTDPDSDLVIFDGLRPGTYRCWPDQLDFYNGDPLVVSVNEGEAVTVPLSLTEVVSGQPVVALHGLDTSSLSGLGLFIRRDTGEKVRFDESAPGRYRGQAALPTGVYRLEFPLDGGCRPVNGVVDDFGRWSCELLVSAGGGEVFVEVCPRE